MNWPEFKQSLSDDQPPLKLSIYLQALWYDGKNNWEKAHTLIQDLHDDHSTWIHAYLHRKEGDIGNADYWYRQAGRKRPTTTLKEEWEEISQALLV